MLQKPPFLGAVKVASGFPRSEQCCVSVRPFPRWSLLPVFYVLNDLGKRWDEGSEANAGAGLLSPLQSSPCPLPLTVLRSTAPLRFSNALFSSSTSLLSLVPSVPLSAAWRNSPFTGFTGQLLSSSLHVGNSQLQRSGWPRALCSQPLVPLRAGLLLFVWSAAPSTLQFPEDQSLNCF